MLRPLTFFFFLLILGNLECSIVPKDERDINVNDDFDYVIPDRSAAEPACGYLGHKIKLQEQGEKIPLDVLNGIKNFSIYC